MVNYENVNQRNLDSLKNIKYEQDLINHQLDEIEKLLDDVLNMEGMTDTSDDGNVGYMIREMSKQVDEIDKDLLSLESNIVKVISKDQLDKRIEEVSKYKDSQILEVLNDFYSDLQTLKYKQVSNL